MKRRVILSPLAVFFLVVSAAMAPQTALANSKYAALVIHAETGDVLFDRYSKEYRYPASLTKVMTLYMMFEAIEAGELSLDTKMKVSRNASLQPASRLGLARGTTIDVETAIEALIIRSANDVATVVAEHLGKSESNFARRMTQRARQMGMRRTTFRNASGLPDRRQRTTARDMAILAQRVSQDFPQYWDYFDRSKFTWKGKTYRSHNRVALTYKGADGLKTGYTRSSGFNLATTAGRGDHKLIGIVLGGRSAATRDRHMREILDKAFADIGRRPHLIKATHSIKPVPALRPGRVAPTPASPGAILAESRVPVPTPKTVALADAIMTSAPTPGAVRLDIAALNATLADLPGANPIGQGDAEPVDARNWIIQVGAYSTQRLALARIEEVRSVVRELALIPGREVRITSKDGKPLYRAQFTRLTEAEAADSCAAIRASGSDCLRMQQ